MYHLSVTTTCADPENFVREGLTLTMFFFSLMREELSKKHYWRALFGPPAKRHLNGVSLACRLWPKMAWYPYDVKGIGTSIAKKTYILVISRGRS